VNEFQRMIEEDRALACEKCNGNGWLGGRQLVTIGGVLISQDMTRRCEACAGTGVRGCLRG
jgi:DnaJ-class molecular chaperone